MSDNSELNNIDSIKTDIIEKRAKNIDTNNDVKKYVKKLIKLDLLGDVIVNYSNDNMVITPKSPRKKSKEF